MLILAADSRLAGPALAGLADADRIADGALAIEHQIKPTLVGFDDDGAGRLIAAIGHHIRARLRRRRRK